MESLQPGVGGHSLFRRQSRARGGAAPAARGPGRFAGLRGSVARRWLLHRLGAATGLADLAAALGRLADDLELFRAAAQAALSRTG